MRSWAYETIQLIKLHSTIIIRPEAAAEGQNWSFILLVAIKYTNIPLNLA